MSKKPVMTKLHQPRMVESSVIRIRPRDEEPKMMADGGPTTAAMESRPDKGWGAIIVKGKQHEEDEQMMAEGGMAKEMDMQPMEEADEEHHESIAAAIMARERRKMMAEGGQVDLAQNAQEEANEADSLNQDALMKENYSESDGLDQLDSAQDDDQDMISQIRRQMNRQRKG